MVPDSRFHPPEPARSLSEETAAALRAVIAERWRAVEDAEGRLAHVVTQAAREAKALGLRPEELIIFLKGIEDDVMAQPGTLRASDLDARRRFREWLVSSCLRAYFSDPAKPVGDGDPGPPA